MTEISTEELAQWLESIMVGPLCLAPLTNAEYNACSDALTEAAARLRALAEDAERLEKAIVFYANPRRYRGPNLYKAHEPNVDQYGHDDCPYVWDVTRDGGEIARQAIDKARHD